MKIKELNQWFIRTPEELYLANIKTEEDWYTYLYEFCEDDILPIEMDRYFTYFEKILPILFNRRYTPKYAANIIIKLYNKKFKKWMKS